MFVQKLNFEHTRLWTSELHVRGIKIFKTFGNFFLQINFLPFKIYRLNLSNELAHCSKCVNLFKGKWNCFSETHCHSSVPKFIRKVLNEIKNMKENSSWSAINETQHWCLAVRVWFVCLRGWQCYFCNYIVILRLGGSQLIKRKLLRKQLWQQTESNIWKFNRTDSNSTAFAWHIFPLVPWSIHLCIAWSHFWSFPSLLQSSPLKSVSSPEWS